MRMHSNTIFITGGTSGIGRGLAEAFHKLGNQVVITGRREDLLRKICDAHPGMRHYAMDVKDPVSIRQVSAQAMADFPGLNCVFNNAGMQRPHNFASADPLDESAVLELCGTGIRSMTRLGASSWPVWQGVLSANAAEVAQEVRAFSAILSDIADALAAGDAVRLGPQFERASDAVARLRENDPGSGTVIGD